MRTLNLQGFDIIQPDDNIIVMIWLGDNIAIAILNYFELYGWMTILMSSSGYIIFLA
jgi:hypothetical protein